MLVTVVSAYDDESRSAELVVESGCNDLPTNWRPAELGDRSSALKASLIERANDVF